MATISAVPPDEVRVNSGSPELSDAGNAERLVRAYGEDLRFVPGWGWVVWSGVRWVRCDLTPRKLMMRVARSIHGEAAQSQDKAEQKDVGLWALKSQSAPRIQGALWCAQPMVAGQVEEFDRQPWLFPCANGTVDLRTGTLYPHRREHMLTRSSSVIHSPGATAPTWESFLARVLPDPDVRAFVKRFAGYCLTGLTTEQALLFLYGVGRNGKSVFVETLAALMGDFHTATRIDTLAISHGGGIPNDVAALAGARLVTVSETPEGVRLNESLVKDLTGGDTISARFLRHEYFQFTPQFKLMIRGNHKPQIRGTDDGIWRRLMLVPFTVQIPPSEVDPELPEKLRAELPGILSWAIAGCLEWQREGLKPPQIVRDAVAEYRGEMDIFGEFIADRCVEAPHAQASASELYRAYRQWAESAGHAPVSATRFGLALGERGYTRTKPNKTIVWRGIGLLSDTSDSSDPFPISPDSCARDGGKPEKWSEPSDRRNQCPKCGGEGCGWCGGSL